MITIIKKVLIIALIWTAIMTIAQAFFCDKMTNTELFERVPDSFLLQFKYCD